MQIISSLFQRDYDRDLRDDLRAAVRSEVADREAAKSGWISTALRIARASNIDYHRMLLISIIVFMLIPPAILAVLVVSRPPVSSSAMSIQELRVTLQFAPAFFAGVLGFMIALVPLSGKRGRRNAIFPVWDDTLSRWLTIVWSGLFSTVFLVSLYCFQTTTSPVAHVPVMAAILFSLLNALTLTSLFICAVRVLPPSYACGPVVAMLIILCFGMFLAAIEADGVATTGALRILGIAVSPTGWVSNLFLETWVEQNAFGLLLLIPIGGTIWYGFRFSIEMYNMQPKTNYFEQQIGEKLERQRRRKSSAIYFGKLPWSGKRDINSSNSLVANDSSVGARIDFFAGDQKGIGQSFIAWLIGQRMWRLSSNQPFRDDRFTIETPRTVILAIGLAILWWGASAGIHERGMIHMVLGLCEGVLIGVCTIRSSASLTGGGCPRRYPLSYWRVQIGALNVTLVNLLLALPIYIMYLAALHGVEPLMRQELGCHFFGFVSAWLLIAGVVLPNGFPLSNPAIRIVLACLYCSAGTAVFMTPILITLHFQIAKLILETPPEVLEQNLSVFVWLGYPYALLIVLAALAFGGIAHFIGYTIVYVYWQQDFRGTAISYYARRDSDA